MSQSEEEWISDFESSSEESDLEDAKESSPEDEEGEESSSKEEKKELPSNENEEDQLESSLQAFMHLYEDDHNDDCNEICELHGNHREQFKIMYYVMKKYEKVSGIELNAYQEAIFHNIFISDASTSH